MVTAAAARRMALALPEATEQDHHGMNSFRVQGKIFATVPDREHLHVMVDEHLAYAAVEAAPRAFELLWWGKKLSGIRVTLAHAEERMLTDMLEEAWKLRAPARLLAPPSPATVKKKPKTTRPNIKKGMGMGKG